MRREGGGVLSLEMTHMIRESDRDLEDGCLSTQRNSKTQRLVGREQQMPIHACGKRKGKTPESWDECKSPYRTAEEGSIPFLLCDANIFVKYKSECKPSTFAKKIEPAEEKGDELLLVDRVRVIPIDITENLIVCPSN